MVKHVTAQHGVTVQESLKVIMWALLIKIIMSSDQSILSRDSHGVDCSGPPAKESCPGSQLPELKQLAGL